MGFSVPPLVEYLLATERPGGGALVGRGAQQTTVPFFPASSSISYQSTPTVGYYAVLGFALTVGRTPPDVYEATIIQYGQQHYTGIVTAEMLRDGFWTYLLVTDAQPIRWVVSNQDTIPHTFEIVTHFVTIVNQEDLGIIRSVVHRRRASNADELLLDRIVRALESRDGVPAGVPLSALRIPR